MGVSSTALARRIRDAQVAAEVSQDEAAEALGISQPTYYRIEAGSDASRATNWSSLPMKAMRERLYSYLELDSYLADQGLASI